MTEFTASNGIRVWINERGSTCTSTGRGSEHTQALREFFRHERDEELGRWRDPMNPNIVVYRLPHDDDHCGRCVRAIDERTGEQQRCWDSITGSDASLYEPDTLFDSAARYFAAHAVSRPWHDAKPGEVWVLTCDGEELLFMESHGAWYSRCGVRVVLEPPIDDPRITAGRRIWPEP